MFRIISGNLKGKRILAPKYNTARSTTDYAKETLFGMLSHRIEYEKIKVLDLFSGLGSIAFEFASRGTPHITLIENNKVQLKFIFDYVKKFNFFNVFTIIKQDVFYWLSKGYHQKFDVVFADPPFEMSLIDYQKLLNWIFDQDILNQDAYFILEHPSKNNLISNQYYIETRKCGKISLSFYQKK